MATLALAAVLGTATLGTAAFGTAALRAQEGTPYPEEYDDGIRGICQKCAAPPASYRSWLMLSVPQWGYGYADLLGDLVRWGRSRWVTIDSIGASVENRALWQLEITDPSTSLATKRRVFMHARTHPNEVQGTRVVNEIISLLLSDDPFAARLRERFVFDIVPMYNPDGVELEKPRENAHDIDLERGWDKDPMEPEVATLKRRFTELMSGARPIDLALNLHSAGLCKRYFVYHEASGTSAGFAELQQRFISQVRAWFPVGIEPWDFYRSWGDSTPTHFPESWWWFNFHEGVLALTYEDMNCSSAGMYDSTASAILHGIGAFFGATEPAAVEETAAERAATATMSVAPNPATEMISIRYRLPLPGRVTVTLHDQLGRLVATPVDTQEDAGEHESRWRVTSLPPGVYICSLRFDRTLLVSSITILR